jgi:hypothetical protein
MAPEKMALDWNPLDSIRRGKPKNKWKRIVIKETGK